MGGLDKLSKVNEQGGWNKRGMEKAKPKLSEAIISIPRSLFKRKEDVGCIKGKQFLVKL